MHGPMRLEMDAERAASPDVECEAEGGVECGLDDLPIPLFGCVLDKEVDASPCRPQKVEALLQSARPQCVTVGGTMRHTLYVPSVFRQRQSSSPSIGSAGSFNGTCSPGARSLESHDTSMATFDSEQ